MKQGDRFTYKGRRFLVTTVDTNWNTRWWKAIDLDGKTTLQGNARMEVEKNTAGLIRGTAPVSVLPKGSGGSWAGAVGMVVVCMVCSA